MTVQYSDMQIGDEIALLKLQPVNRTTLALYCGASGDHNPIHVDLDFARKSRMADACVAFFNEQLGRLLTAWVPQSQVRSLSVRFTGITQLGHIPTCTGKVIEKFEEAGEQRVRLALRCANQYGEEKLAGEAVVTLA